MRSKNKRWAALAAGLLLLGNLSVPAFAEEAEEAEEAYPANYDMEYYSRFQGQDMTINVYNWGEYIANGEDGSMDINKEFEELTGIKVNYTLFDTNESMYAKLKSGGSSYDVVIPSDYMISRMIDEGMLEPLNFENIPNFQYIDPQFVNPAYDPENLYSVPYTWGTVGIIYNYDMLGYDPDSWGVMWDEALAGQILQFSNVKDDINLTLLYLGYDMNSSDFDDLDDAAEALKQQKPLVQAYVMDQVFDKMQNNEAAVAPYYAGDAITMMEANPSLRFVIPKEGSMRFADAMVIPKLPDQSEESLKRKEAAEMYINFLNEPNVAAENIEYICYSTANTAALELLPDDVKNNPVAYPDAETLSRTYSQINLGDEANQYMDKLWTDIMSADQGYSEWAMPMFLVGALALSAFITWFRKDRKRRRERVEYTSLFEKQNY